MSATSATSSSTSATSSTSSAGKEVKKEHKGEDQVASLGQRAMNRMVDKFVGNFLTGRIIPKGDRPIDAVRSGLALQEVPEEIPPLPEGLQLTKEETATLNEVFASRAISGRHLSLVHLWAVDLFAQMERLKRKVPDGEKWIGQFAEKYYAFHASMWERNHFQPIRPEVRKGLFMQKDWEGFLERLSKEWGQHVQKVPAIECVQKKIALGLSLLRKPDGAEIFYKRPISSLKVLLPEVELLESTSLEKNQDDLLVLARFATTGATLAAQALGLTQPRAEELLKACVAFRNEQDGYAAAVLLKKTLVEFIILSQTSVEEIIEKIGALERKLKKRLLESPEMQRLSSFFFQTKTYQDFMVRLLVTLDRQTLPLISPDSHLPTPLAHHRTYPFMTDVMFPKSEYALFATLSSLPSSLISPASDLQPDLLKLFNAQRQATLRFIRQTAAFDEGGFKKCATFFLKMHPTPDPKVPQKDKAVSEDNTVHFLIFWKMISPYCLHSNIQKSRPGINKLRAQFNREMAHFLRTKVKGSPSDIQEKWVPFCQQMAFEMGVDLMRYFFACQDVSALSVYHIDPKRHQIDEVLFDELIDFMNCEGLVELLTGGGKSSQEETPEETKEEQKPEQKGSEASAASASQTTTTSSVSQQQAQRATSATSSASQSQAQSTSRSSSTLTPLELRRLRKRDELINVLQKMGLTKEEGAKHTKMRDSEGNVVTIVSRGSSDIPKGTMQSITQQVLQHVSQTSASHVSSTKSTTSS